MVRNPKVPASGLLISCLRHMDAGRIVRTAGGIWVRKDAHANSYRQVRCDVEVKYLLARGWALVVEGDTTSDGRIADLARPTDDGYEEIKNHLAQRAA